MNQKLRVVSIFLVFLLFPLLTSLAEAQTITFAQATGGAAISGGLLPPLVYHSGFGSVNGLGIGTPSTGITTVAATGGYLYYTPYTISVLTVPGQPASVDAYISGNFSNSASVIQLMSCAAPGTCTSYGNYNNLATTQAGEIPVIPNSSGNGNYTAYLGLFVHSFNGSITASDSATVTFDVYDKHGNNVENVKLTLNTPAVSVQTAIQLQILPGGVISTGGTGSPPPDYAANFGTVNGLGIGPGSGLTITPGQVSNASLYTTSYTLEPAFSGFSSTSASIDIYVSTNFMHPAILQLYDSAASGSGYTLIPSSAGTAQLTSVSNGIAITRYLGLSVSNSNGAGSFTGSDSATLTYLFTVP